MAERDFYLSALIFLYNTMLSDFDSIVLYYFNVF